MTVSLLIAGDNRKGFDQIGKNWITLVRFCDDLVLYLNCTTSTDNLDFKSGLSVKFWSSDVLLWILVS